jgi:restriction system protein
MAVPDYQSLMLPLLRFAAQKGIEISTSEAVDTLAKELGLTEDDLKEMLPSGIQSTFVNRVGWASTYMKKAGLLESTRRGFYQITERGKDLRGFKLQVQQPAFQLLRRILREESCIQASSSACC